MSSSFPFTSNLMLKAMRDAKDLQQTAHPMDRMAVLLDMATRDENIQQRYLIDTLMTIIEGLHKRICDLEAPAKPLHHQINNPEDEDSE